MEIMKLWWSCNKIILRFSTLQSLWFILKRVEGEVMGSRSTRAYANLPIKKELEHKSILGSKKCWLKNRTSLFYSTFIYWRKKHNKWCFVLLLKLQLTILIATSTQHNHFCDFNLGFFLDTSTCNTSTFSRKSSHIYLIPLHKSKCPNGLEKREDKFW